jgi:hypothetical protein
MDMSRKIRARMDSTPLAPSMKTFCLLTTPDSKTWPDMMGTLEDGSYSVKLLPEPRR